MAPPFRLVRPHRRERAPSPKSLVAATIRSIALLASFAVSPASAALLQPERIAQLFERFDRDGNGKVTQEELSNARLFDRLDRNRDGQITLDEVRSVRGSDQTSDPASSSSESTEAASDDAQRAEEAAAAVAPDADKEIRRGPRRASPVERGIGGFVPDVELTDVRGDRHSLAEVARDKVLVVAATSTGCPLSLKFAPILVETAREFAPRQVAFVIVDSVATDETSEILRLQQDFDRSAICVADPNGSIARQLGLTTTTDTLVADRHRTVVFRGAVDDRFGFGYANPDAKRHYLREAIEAAIEVNSPAVVATDAPGCLLDLPVETADVRTSQVTYHGAISRLIAVHCVECHRRGGVAPFALDSYEAVVSHGAMIRETIERGVMPPWFAVESMPGPSPWANDRSLPEADRRLLFEWLASDRPLGDPAEAAPPRVFHDGWSIGEPDAVFGFETPVAIPATGTMPYRNVVVETDLPEDRWVSAIEVRPGNPAVVHHVIVSVIPPGADDQADDGVVERQGFWGIYVPGNASLVYPPGYAKRLPKGARLRFQMHYTPNGRATEDLTRIGVVFADAPPEHEVRVHGLANVRFRIPPHAADHHEQAEIVLPQDVDVLAFLPHMHLRGKSARYSVTSADGERTLLDVPHYDFNWQLLYRYAEPVRLKRGDRLTFQVVFDNSERNPANPNPGETVRWGPQTDDEMLLGYVEYVVPGIEPGEAAPRLPRLPGRLRERLSGAGGRSDAETSGAADSAENAEDDPQDSPPPSPARRPSFDRLDADRDGRVTWEEVRRAFPERGAVLKSLFERLDTDGDGGLDRNEASRLSGG